MSKSPVFLLPVVVLEPVVFPVDVDVDAIGPLTVVLLELVSREKVSR